MHNGKGVRERLQSQLNRARLRSAEDCVQAMTQLEQLEVSYQSGAVNKLPADQRILFLRQAIQLTEEIRHYVNASHLIVVYTGAPLTTAEADFAYAQWQVRLAETYFYQQDDENARKAIREAEKIAHPNCYYLLGRLSEESGNLQKAKQYYATVYRHFKTPTEVYHFYYLGHAQLREANIDLNANADPQVVEARMQNAVANLRQAQVPSLLCKALQDLGHLYGDGPAILYNIEKARAFFEEAITHQEWLAYFHFAMVLLRQPHLTPADLEHAKKLLEQASGLTTDPTPRFNIAALNDATGQKELAVVQYKQCGEFPAAMHNLSACYHRGEGMAKPDPEASFALLKSLVEKHQYAPAALDYAQALFDRGGANNIRQAQKILRAAKQRKEPYAEHNIGYFILQRHWPTRNRVDDALACYQAAAAKGIWESLLNCALLSIVKNDFAVAKEWFLRAARHPEPKDGRHFIAANILDLINEYHVSPSQSLRASIEFLVTEMEGFKELPAPAAPKAGTVQLEDLAAVKCQGSGDFATIKTRYCDALAEFQHHTHQHFKALNRTLVARRKATYLTPFCQLQYTLEDILTANDADHINLLTALQDVSTQISQNRYESPLFTNNYASIIQLYRLLGAQINRLTTARELVGGFVSLSKLHLTSAIHDELGYLQPLLLALVLAVSGEPEHTQIVTVLSALHRLGKTKAVLDCDLKALFQATAQCATQFSTEQLAMACYALAVLHNQFRFAKTENKAPLENCLSALLLEASQRIDCSEVPAKHQHAWYHAFTYGERFQLIKPKALLSHQAYFREHPAHLLCKDRIAGSLLQEEITDFITSHFKKVKKEQPVQGLLVDIYLDFGLDSVIVQVNGPGHYLYDPKQPASEFTSKDLFRNVLLGKRLVHISYCEWARCDTDAERAKLLKNKLFSFNVPLPASLKDLTLARASSPCNPKPK